MSYIIAFDTVDMYKGRQYSVCVTRVDETGKAETFGLPLSQEVYHLLKQALGLLWQKGEAVTRDFGKSYLVKQGEENNA